MTSTARPTPRLSLAVSAALFVTLLAFFIWLISFSPYRVFPFFIAGQAYLVIALIFAFRYWPPITRCFRFMPVPHRLVFGVLAGSLILGHLTMRSTAYFPFISWGIFSWSREDDPVICPEFLATTKSGREVRLLVEQQFPSIVQVWPVNGHRYTPALVDHLAAALAKSYNSRHPDDPVRQVDLMLMSVKLTPDPGTSQLQPSCQLQKRYDFSSGL